MLPEKFRRQLRQEAEQWRSNGEISEAQFQRFSDRYQFNQIQTGSRELVLLFAGFGFGALLTQVLSGFLLFLVWGTVQLAIAYGLRLQSFGIFAISLFGVGYWLNWNQIFLTPDPGGIEMIGLQMPIVAAILFTPLAYWCRSIWIFWLSTIAINSALLSSLVAIVTKSSALPALLIGLPAALLWSYDDRLWTTRTRKPFQSIARQGAIVYLSMLLLWFSHSWVWDGSQIWSSRVPEWRSLPSVVILAGVAIVQWLYLLRDVKRINPNTIGVGLILSVSTIVNFWHLRIQALPTFAPFLFNLILMALAFGTIRNGIDRAQHRPFWFGIGLVTLQILSRLSGLETTPVIRLFACILCTVGAIAFGYWFEQRFKVTSL